MSFWEILLYCRALQGACLASSFFPSCYFSLPPNSLAEFSPSLVLRVENREKEHSLKSGDSCSLRIESSRWPIYHCWFILPWAAFEKLLFLFSEIFTNSILELPAVWLGRYLLWLTGYDSPSSDPGFRQAALLWIPLLLSPLGQNLFQATSHFLLQAWLVHTSLPTLKGGTATYP